MSPSHPTSRPPWGIPGCTTRSHLINSSLCSAMRTGLLSLTASCGAAQSRARRLRGTSRLASRCNLRSRGRSAVERAFEEFRISEMGQRALSDLLLTGRVAASVAFAAAAALLSYATAVAAPAFLAYCTPTADAPAPGLAFLRAIKWRRQAACAGCV